MKKGVTWAVLCVVIATGLFACGVKGGSDSTPATTTYSISGTVTASSAGVRLQGVTITLSGPNSAAAATDASGNFSFPRLANGSYTVTPAKTGYTFSPASTTQIVKNASIAGSNFIATTTTLYSNSSLKGAWLYLFPSSPGKNGFAEFDGNGTMTNTSGFYPGAPPGSYHVRSDGSFAFTTNPIGFPPDQGSGVLTSSSIATMTLPAAGGMVKVSNIAACQGTWTGILTEITGGSATHAFRFLVDANGAITSMTGFTSPVSGAMFSESGYLVAFFDTAEPSLYDQFRLAGQISGSEASGTFTAIGTGAGLSVTGNFTLTKQ